MAEAFRYGMALAHGELIGFYFGGNGRDDCDQDAGKTGCPLQGLSCRTPSVSGCLMLHR
jgi:hypothetical protein